MLFVRALLTATLFVAAAISAAQPAPRSGQRPARPSIEALQATIEAQPGTEAGLEAMRSLLFAIAERGKMQDGVMVYAPEDSRQLADVAALALKHHASNPGIGDLATIYSFSVGPVEGAKYLRSVYDATSLDDVRRSVAVTTINSSVVAYNKIGAPQQDRDFIASNLREIVKLMHRDLADDAHALKHGDLAVKGLDIAVGDRLGNLECPTVEGGHDAIANHRGKILIVDIWATWCSPCVEGQPSLLAFSEEMKGKPLEVFTLSMDRKPEDVIKHQVKQPMPWINGYIGMGAPVLAEWGINGYPTYFVLDAEGVIRARTGEFDDKTKDYVRQLVAKLEAGSKQ